MRTTLRLAMVGYLISSGALCWGCTASGLPPEGTLLTWGALSLVAGESVLRWLAPPTAPERPSERSAAQGAHAQSATFSAILSALMDGVLTCTPAGIITYHNAQAVELAASPAPEDTDVSPAAGQGADSPALTGRALASLAKGEQLLELLAICTREGATSREVHHAEQSLLVSVLKLQNPSQTPEYLFILRDVTSLRQLETARSHFLGNVSHELKTPLTIIKGFVITLLKSPGIVDEWKRYLDFIDKETDRLSRLVEELLDLARLRSKRTQMNLSFCDPNELLREIYRQLEPQASKYDSELRLVLRTPLPRLIADPDRFTEIVINLVENAFKYSPPREIVELAADASEEYVHLHVTDRGQGIAKEDIPFVFERFFRGSNRGGRKAGGSGIGLAIVKEIVEAHRGRLAVESQAGVGTTFHVSLPLRQTSRPRPGDDSEQRTELAPAELPSQQKRPAAS
jgi:signal transduction histidine kinase